MVLPENYKTDDDSAKPKTPGATLKQVKDVVNAKAKPAMAAAEEVEVEELMIEEETTDEVVAFEEETTTEVVLKKKLLKKR